MDEIQFNAEHPDDSHDKWAEDYARTEAEIAHFITDDMWRRGGLA